MRTSHFFFDGSVQSEGLFFLPFLGLKVTIIEDCTYYNPVESAMDRTEDEFLAEYSAISAS